MIQAEVYRKMGDYQKAKAVIETLPRDFSIRDSALASILSGKDKLNGAILSRCHHLQCLYQACMKEGDAWFTMEKYNETFYDGTTPDEYIPEALKCYQKGLRVLTTFLLDDLYDEPSDQYLWDGMQTFHWTFHQCIAACHKKLGNMEECEKSIAEAHRLISVVWKDFEENKNQYMKYFNQYLRDYDLAEYIK